MGGLFSRWRAKPSTVEVLENIDKEIQALEEFREKKSEIAKIMGWKINYLFFNSLPVYLFNCVLVVSS